VLVARELLGLDVQGAELQPLRKGRAEGVYRETARDLLSLGKKRARSEEDWERFLEDSRGRIRDAVGRLRKGSIVAEPKTCDNCDYNSVCRFEKKELPFIEYEKRKREEKS
jgi:ATP-dependent helicase/DNAse subunit B